MNKFIKIAVSFIIFGIVLIGLATYLNNGHIPRFSSNSEKKNYTVSIYDVKNLDLEIIDSDVIIEENTDSKNMEIEYYTALERKVNIEHIGNKLSIKENKNISYQKRDGQEKIISVIDNGETELSGHETVSMNLFGFTPKVFDFFEEYFQNFIHKYAESEKVECLLPETAGAIIQKGLGRIKVYTTTERWFGMTYPEDREIVKAELAKKIKDKYYPEFLWR